MLRILAFTCTLAALALLSGTTSAAKPKTGAADGTIKSVDATAGTLTVAVKAKKETADKQFTIGDSTKVTILDGDNKTELTGKAGLKDSHVKAGAHAHVTTDADGKVTAVTVGMPKKKK